MYSDSPSNYYSTVKNSQKYNHDDTNAYNSDAYEVQNDNKMNGFGHNSMNYQRSDRVNYRNYSPSFNNSFPNSNNNNNNNDRDFRPINFIGNRSPQKFQVNGFHNDQNQRTMQNGFHHSHLASNENNTSTNTNNSFIQKRYGTQKNFNKISRDFDDGENFQTEDSNQTNYVNGQHEPVNSVPQGYQQNELPGNRINGFARRFNNNVNSYVPQTQKNNNSFENLPTSDEINAQQVQTFIKVNRQKGLEASRMKQEITKLMHILQECHGDYLMIMRKQYRESILFDSLKLVLMSCSEQERNYYLLTNNLEEPSKVREAQKKLLQLAMQKFTRQYKIWRASSLEGVDQHERGNQQKPVREMIDNDDNSDSSTTSTDFIIDRAVQSKRRNLFLKKSQNHQKFIRNNQTAEPHVQHKNIKIEPKIESTNIDQTSQQQSNLNSNSLPFSGPNNNNNNNNNQDPYQPQFRRIPRIEYEITMDHTRICNTLDLNSKFTDFHDSIDRLLPYHVLTTTGDINQDDIEQDKMILNEINEGLAAKIADVQEKFFSNQSFRAASNLQSTTSECILLDRLWLSENYDFTPEKQQYPIVPWYHDSTLMPRHNPIKTTTSSTTTYNNYNLSSPRVTKIYHQPAQKLNTSESLNSKTITTTRFIGSNAGPSSRPLASPCRTKIYNNTNYRLIQRSSPIMLSKPKNNNNNNIVMKRSFPPKVIKISRPIPSSLNSDRKRFASGQNISNNTRIEGNSPSLSDSRDRNHSGPLTGSSSVSASSYSNSYSKNSSNSHNKIDLNNSSGSTTNSTSHFEAHYDQNEYSNEPIYQLNQVTVSSDTEIERNSQSSYDSVGKKVKAVNSRKRPRDSGEVYFWGFIVFILVTKNFHQRSSISFFNPLLYSSMENTLDQNSLQKFDKSRQEAAKIVAGLFDDTELLTYDKSQPRPKIATMKMSEWEENTQRENLIEVNNNSTEFQEEAYEDQDLPTSDNIGADLPASTFQNSDLGRMFRGQDKNWE